MIRLMCALLLVFSFGVFAEEEAGDDPHLFFQGFVEHMNSLLGVVRGEEQYFSKSTEVLVVLVGDYVDSYIDYEGISQFVVGKYWRWATKEEKSEFIVEFRRELLWSYSRFVLRYSSQPIEWSYTYKERKKHILVTAESGKNKLKFYFRQIAQSENKWMLYDIKVNSISITSGYRSTYRRILQLPERRTARKTIKILTRTIKRRNNARID